MNPIRRKSERGNALMEFAIGFTVLWLMFAGVYQIGYSYYVYNTLMLSVSDAAELGSVLDYDVGSPSAYTTALKNMVVYGDEIAGTKALVPGLTTSHVNVNVALDSAGMPRDVTVNITGYTISAIFGSFNLTNKPRATTLFYGQVVCGSCS